MKLNDGEWIDIKTLADAWLPPDASKKEMEKKEASLLKAIQRKKYTTAKKSGKVWQIHLSDPAIPAPIRVKIADKILKTDPPGLSVIAATLHAIIPKNLTVAGTHDLNGDQERIRDARFQLLSMIERQCQNGKGVTAAIQDIADKINNRTDEHLVKIAAKAHDRDKKGCRGLSVPTLYRWRARYQGTGKKQNALAPKRKDPRKDLFEWVTEYKPHTAAVAVLPTSIPTWLPFFLDEYRRPQKPSIRQALDWISRNMPSDISPPSYHQVLRVLKKLPALCRAKGRKSGAEYCSQRSYTERDTSKFEPGDIVLCDGHSFKAYVAHPEHGRPFHPEVCAVVDSVTRLVWGWSAGLAESSFTVADAIRDTVTVRPGKPATIPAILYTDNGSGNTSTANADDITGIFPRLGITFKTGRPGNPQAHGRIERLQSSLWIRAAKELPTYTGRGMDGLTRRKIYLTLDKDVRESRKTGGRVNSDLLMSWADFLAYCDQVVAEYNRRPHSSLPRIRDAVTGFKRHQTPLERLEEFAQRGWIPTLPEPEELQHLFRPQVQVKARRGLVTVFGNKYHNSELEHYQGDLVNVSYDIHDASQVWVRDWEQRLICTAKFEGNKRDFFAVPVVEQAREQRRKRRTATLERHLEEVQLEAKAPVDIMTKMELASEIIQGEQIRLEREQKREESRKHLYFDSIDEVYDDIRGREQKGAASAYEIHWANDKDRSFGKRVGLYKEDPECGRRYNPENKIEIPAPPQQLIKKAISA